MKRRLKAAMAARELEKRRAKPHAEKVLGQLREWDGGNDDVQEDLAGTPILTTVISEFCKNHFPFQILEPDEALIAFNLGVALDSSEKASTAMPLLWIYYRQHSIE